MDSNDLISYDNAQLFGYDIEKIINKLPTAEEMKEIILNSVKPEELDLQESVRKFKKDTENLNEMLGKFEEKFDNKIDQTVEFLNGINTNVAKGEEVKETVITKVKNFSNYVHVTVSSIRELLSKFKV